MSKTRKNSAKRSRIITLSCSKGHDFQAGDEHVEYVLGARCPVCREWVNNNAKGSKLASFAQCIDTTTQFKVECCICGAEELDETDGYDGDSKPFADRLMKEGWQEGVSNKFAVMGAMCPTCYKTPDKDRGED